jgi:hypothetical protein
VSGASLCTCRTGAEVGLCPPEPLFNAGPRLRLDRPHAVGGAGASPGRGLGAAQGGRRALRPLQPAAGEWWPVCCCGRSPARELAVLLCSAGFQLPWLSALAHLAATRSHMLLPPCFRVTADVPHCTALYRMCRATASWRACLWIAPTRRTSRWLPGTSRCGAAGVSCLYCRSLLKL